MMIVRGNTGRLALTLGLVAFLLLGTFGFSHAGMATGMDGQMSNCPFSPGVAICNMTPLEMISASQSLFTTLAQQRGVFSLLAFLIAAASALALLGRPLIIPRLAVAHVFRHKRAYVSFRNPLQELFSSGVLNPKIF